ncbi:uncharacterized protein [Primulina huaijiensis]|uniref:uncharacterized protein n=1 Tax=Primulina huaijiensis TaxID=1492673 RepID=UPI003CC72867
MEELKRPNHAPEKKQVVVNIGKVSAHGRGGIGGVILLGGALAAAGFASTFIIGKMRQGGSRDNSRRNTRIPPPPAPPLAAVNKKDERENEANVKEQFTCLDADKHSSETTKEIEFKNDSQSLVLHEKYRTEIDGVAVCDSETSEQILCSITPKRPQKGAISNGGVSHLPAQEQKTLEIENTTVHQVKIQPSGEVAIDENGTTKECKQFEEVEAEGEGRDDREIELMGEIHEVKCEDAKKSNGNHVPVIGLKFSEEGTFVLEHGKDGQESSLPVVGSPISKHKNVDDDEKQNFLSSDLQEIIHDGVAIQQDEDDQLEHIEEHLIQEREKCNEPDEEIVPQTVVEEKEDAQCEENIEEKGYIDNSTPENRQLGDSDKEDVQILAVHFPDDESISPEEMEAAEDDAVNGEIEMSFCHHKDTEDEVEDSSETIDTGIATAEDEDNIIDGTDGDEDLSNETEQNTEGTVDTSMESKLGGGGVWPAAIQEPSIETQQEKLVNREIEGKIQEDTTVKQGKYERNPNKNIADYTKIMNGRCNSAKTFIERHAVDLATLKGYSTNSGTRKALLLAIPVLSSVSCSWFFGLSFDKFCFVVLLTIVLSKSMIVK